MEAEDIDIQPDEIMAEGDDDGMNNEECCFSDDEHDDQFWRRSRDASSACDRQKCPLCDNASKTLSNVVDKMHAIHHDTLGTISSNAMYDMLAEWYKETYVDEQIRGGLDCESLDSDQIRLHFEKHHKDPLQRVVWNIDFLQTMNRDLRYKGIRMRSANGQIIFDMKKATMAAKFIDQEMKLLREFTRLKEKTRKRKRSEPPVFNAF